MVPDTIRQGESNLPLHPYPYYKSYNIPWLGDVPEHWEVQRLKNWVGINEAVLPETTEPDFEFPYLEIGAVGTGLLVSQPTRTRFASAPSRARRIVRTGDTIVSTVRTYLKATWFAGEVEDDLICSTGFVVLTPRNNVWPKFLSYIAQSNPFSDRITASSAGTAYPAIPESRLGSFHVALPPLLEQRAIVRYLDHVDQRIQRYIKAKRKLIALLEEQKQAIINQAVTRGLDPNVPLKPSGVEWLGEVPDHWEFVPLKRRVGFQEGPGIMAVDFRESGVPLLRISCLRGNVVTLDGCNYLDYEMVRTRLSHFAVRKGDYVLSASASTGAISLVTEEAAGSIPYTGIIRLWSISPKAVMEYVRLFMSSSLFQDQINLAKSGVSIEHFGPSHLNRMFLLLPPPSEQRAIVGRVNEELRALAIAIDRTSRQIELLQEYRTRLIADVVSGTLDVREAADQLPDKDDLTTKVNEGLGENCELTEGMTLKREAIG